MKTLTFSSLRIVRAVQGLSALAAALWIAGIGDIMIWIHRGWGFPLGEYFDAFQDLMIYRTRFLFLHTPAFFNPNIVDKRFDWPPAAFAYPPAAAFLYNIFYKLSQPEAIYIALIGVWCAIFAVVTLLVIVPVLPRGVTAKSFIVTLLLFSFPAVFLAERANLELFVWVLISIGIVLYLRDSPYAAAALIGVAASIKLYPILLLALYFRDRRPWAAIATGIASVIATTLLAVWFCGPGFVFALHGFMDGVLRFKSEHAEGARLMEAPFDHSLFASVKVPYLLMHTTPARWTILYYVLACTLAAGVYLFRVNRLPFVNRLTFITVVMITLPPVSYDYTIVHLYLPLTLLIYGLLHDRKHSRSLSSVAGMACILLAMLPIGLLGNGRFLFAGVLKLLPLLGVAISAAAGPWPSPNLNEMLPSFTRGETLASSPQRLEVA